MENQILKWESYKNPKAKKILCILQNAWGDRELPIIFKPNSGNKSAKVMRKVCGENTIMHFSNTTPVVTSTAAGKAKPDSEHLSKLLEMATEYDLVIVCGKQAEEAVGLAIDEKFKIPIFYMPHPASRSLTNVLCVAINDYVTLPNCKLKNVHFKQISGGHIVSEDI